MNRIREQGTMMDALMKVGQIALALSAKYDPAVAQQLAPVLQQIGMDAGGVPAGALQNPAATGEADAVTGRPSDENALVRNARENANKATRPE